MRSRVWEAVTTLPSARGWLETLGVGVGFAAVALPLGLASGLLHPERARTPALPLHTLLVPGLTEELVFRVLPPPRLAAPALAAYVLFHPLNARRFFRAARPVFYNPVFLLLTALLGGLCTRLYRRTRSLWPPTVLHGSVVAGWLLFLGGSFING